MNLNQLCTRGLIPMMALAFLASDAAAQRIDYAYKRAVTPAGFTTSDCVLYDFAGNRVNTLRGDHIAKLGVSIRDISLNPTGSSLVILADDKKPPCLPYSAPLRSTMPFINSTTRKKASRRL